MSMEGVDYLRAFMLVRPYQCPHCFECFHKPFGLIGRLPLIGRLAQGTTFVRASKQEGVLPQREGDIGAVNRLFRGMGRSVNNAEKAIGKAAMAIFRPIWAVIWFLPSLLLGTRKKKKRRSSRKFLKPTRWKR